MTESVVYLAVALALGGLLALVISLAAGRRRRPVRAFTGLLLSLLLLVSAALFGALVVTTVGYRALTREETAAQIQIEPTGPQRFAAHVRLPDGTEQRFELAGDEVYVDAHILKWKPVANLLGLHTAYELSRIAGRYRSLDNERGAPRTVHALAPEKPLNLFALRQRFAFLSPLVDAEYGSASFVMADRPADFELRVSTSGLLIREVPATDHRPSAPR